MRRRIIAGNWKMHKTLMEGLELVEALKAGYVPDDYYEVVVHPPFTLLHEISRALKGSEIRLGAQNLFYEDEGAYTGEISPLMLKDAGVEYVIIGHSERRKYFHEDNETVLKKVRAALRHGLKPIICVGETLEQREAGKARDVVADQLSILKEIPIGDMEEITIAYEPVWAIGTGKTATPELAEEMHKFIRETVENIFNRDVANNLPILYGGSVKPNNVFDLTSEEDIDGALVGGASLNADSFLSIIKNAARNII